MSLYHPDHLWIFESHKPEWAHGWHLWTVIIPRRSVIRRIIVGQVWRRHDGRRWIYKKFGEYNDVEGNGLAMVGESFRSAIDRKNADRKTITVIPGWASSGAKDGEQQPDIRPETPGQRA